MPIAIFRCDAGHEMGGGHVRRCLALASCLRDLGWETAFATTAQSHAVIPWIPQRERLDVLPAAVADPDALRGLKAEGCDLLIIDHYGLNRDYETRCRGWARQILAVDDLANRPHDCDALLDHNAGRRESDYEGLLPQGAAVLAGPGFALLDHAYALARGESLADPSAPRGLISLGAGENAELIATLLDVVPADTPIVAVSGSVTGQQAAELKAHGARLAKFDLLGLVEARDMAKLMQSCGFALGAGGVSALERCVLGLPSLIVEIAANQGFGIAALAEAGAIIALGTPRELTGQRLKQAFRDLNVACRRRMADAASILCDGFGARRVAAWLDRSIRDGDRSVALRQVRADDEGIMFSWQSHPETRRFARNPNPPSRDEHRAWFTAKLRDRNSIFNVITFDGQAAGVVRLDRRDRLHEVSINVAAELRGRGVAKAALLLAARLLPDGRLGAAILSGNTASLRLFERAGFKQVRDGWFELSCRQAVH